MEGFAPLPVWKFINDKTVEGELRMKQVQAVTELCVKIRALVLTLNTSRVLHSNLVPDQLSPSSSSCFVRFSPLEIMRGHLPTNLGKHLAAWVISFFHS